MDIVLGALSMDSKVNVWEQKAKECKARRNLALSKGCTLDKISITDVENSVEGIDGWASAQVSVAIKPPKAAPKKSGGGAFL